MRTARKQKTLKCFLRYLNHCLYILKILFFNTLVSKWWSDCSWRHNNRGKTRRFLGENSYKKESHGCLGTRISLSESKRKWLTRIKDNDKNKCHYSTWPAGGSKRHLLLDMELIQRMWQEQVGAEFSFTSFLPDNSVFRMQIRRNCIFSG